MSSILNATRSVICFEKNRCNAMRRMAIWQGRLARGRRMEILSLSGIRVGQLSKSYDWPCWALSTNARLMTCRLVENVEEGHKWLFSA